MSKPQKGKRKKSGASPGLRAGSIFLSSPPEPPRVGGRVMPRKSPPYLRTMFGSGRARHARWRCPQRGGPNRTTDNKPVCTAALAPRRA
nr:MAG TPA: hypothetical protein [Caudoviricetes sp.]